MKEDKMLCPLDGETLLMTAREGIEIDYCPRCRGVWLDRGELDKIIERSNSDHPGSVHLSNDSRSLKRKDDDDDDDDDDHKDRRSKKGNEKSKRVKSNRKDGKASFYKKSRKHASFIKELFDF